ncbi:MAG: alpha-galactosidase [Chitinivibrionales bacterium]|nr:alpha-galactosidase [Chitinivibrionales bacterium]
MTRIAIIGAGSGFGSVLSRDILSREPLQDCTIALCDIDERRLGITHEFVAKTIEANNLPAKVEASTERTESLKDADFVVSSVSVGGPAYAGEPYKSEIEIPRKYGVEQSVADTVTPGGVFRFLRTAPVQVAVCRDMERLCPNALLLNYTNPMAMLTWAHHAATAVRNVGLCHSVQGTTDELARYCGVAREEVDAVVAGINHQAWFLELKHKGADLYPTLREKMNDPETFATNAVRFEIMRHFGYFVTESSHHMSEYVPYFRAHAECFERFNLRKRRDIPAKAPDIPRWLKDSIGEDGEIKAGELKPSHEFASGIMQACVTDEPFRFNGNVMNTGLIDNLPAGCCVEVRCIADRTGIHPCHAGPLPPQLAAINRSNIAVQELAVKAFLEKDRDAAFYAVALDPLTAAVLPLHRIREMFDEMWQAEGELLRWFDE